jgi:hypothetical protein
VTSKRSVKAMLKRAKRATDPFTVTFGDETIEGTFTALPFTDWQDLVAAHPPRPDHKVDAGWGYCYATFWPAAIRASMLEPEMDDEDWETFISLLSEAQMSRLGVQVHVLNEARVDLPKSSSPSTATDSPNSD